MRNSDKVKLLKKVLRELKKKKRFTYGLCSFTMDMLYRKELTENEFLNFEEILNTNEPENVYYYYTDQDRPFYFPKGLKQPRIKYLNRLIKKYGVKI